MTRAREQLQAMTSPRAPLRTRAAPLEHRLLRVQRLLGNVAVRRLATEGGPLSDTTEERINTIRGGGRALEGPVRMQMERGLGADLGDVRMHTGSESANLNRELNARAFAVGRDVFFGAGEYRPDSSRGRELIAHELAHVVQQDGAAVQGKLELGRADDPLEAQADDAARAVMRAEAESEREEEQQ